MLLLMGDVIPNRTESGLAYGERTVAGLPCKNMVFGPTPAHPLRRIRFYQTSAIGDGMGSGHAYEKMHVVASAIDAKSDAANLTDDISEVGVYILFELGLDESASLFRAEDEMHEEICGGVRHSFLSPLPGLPFARC